MGRTGLAASNPRWRDLRHAWRMIFRMPGLSAVVILSLGVGIGVNTVVFSWIQALVLRPLPGVPDASRFHPMETRRGGGERPRVLLAEYRDLRERLRGFDRPHRLAHGAAEPGRGRPHGARRRAARLRQLLSPRSACGRCSGASCARTKRSARAASRSSSISHEFWQLRFGGAPAALGQTLRLNDQNLTIVGVAPPGFQGTVLGLDFDLWVPATLAPLLFAGSRELEDRSQRGYALLAITPTARDTGACADRARRGDEPSWPVSTRPRTRRCRRRSSRSGRPCADPSACWRARCWILQALMLLLLVAVCGNAANLMLARASTRQREIGVRLALGASPGRIAGLLLTESVLLAVLGAAAGHRHRGVGYRCPARGAVLHRLAHQVPDARRRDRRSAFASLLGIVCALAFGLAPAVQLARVDPQRALRAGARGDRPQPDAQRRSWGPRWRSLSSCSSWPPSSSGACTTRATRIPASGAKACCWPPTTSPGAASTTRARAPSRPGCSRACAPCPAWRRRHRALRPPRHPRPAPPVLHPRGPSAYGRRLRPGARQHRDSRVLPDDGHPPPGRAPIGGSGRPVAPPQVVVNEEFVRRYLPDVQPLGRRLQSRGGTYTITGVVRNSLLRVVRRAAGADAVLLLSRSSLGGRRDPSSVRTGPETALLPAVRRIVRDIDPTLPVFDVRTLSEHVEKNLVPPPYSRADVRRPRPAPPRPGRHRHLRRGGPCRRPSDRRRSACGWPWAPAPGAWWRRSWARACASSAWACWRDGWWCSWWRSTPRRAARSTRPLLLGVPALLLARGGHGLLGSGPPRDADRSHGGAQARVS